MEKGMMDILNIARLNQIRDSNETAMISEEEREANSKVIDRNMRERVRKLKQEKD